MRVKLSSSKMYHKQISIFTVHISKVKNTMKQRIIYYKHNYMFYVITKQQYFVVSIFFFSFIKRRQKLTKH